MSSNSPIKILSTALIVVAFGWGSGYIVLNGIEYFKPSTILVNVDDQTAQISEAPIIKGANTPIEYPKENELTIMVAGDIMFDRGIRAIGNRNGYDSLFDDSVRSLFKRSDIVVANLEGPITDNVSKTLVDGKTTESFVFTFPPVVADTLKNAGITIVSLANNHTDNFAFAGYRDTENHLRSAGVEWFGNPWNSTSTKLTLHTSPDDSAMTTILEKNGIKIALIGYHGFQKGADRVVAEIRRVSGPDIFTIVMPHWGEEYVYTPSKIMRSYARSFIGAGADAIIAAHPHVVADQEWVGAVPVFYSLGNLLFDQYFSDEEKKLFDACGTTYGWSK
jgi:poly-gamma-glutamate synthesis protein (capsule biosynthesis protein)